MAREHPADAALALNATARKIRTRVRRDVADRMGVTQKIIGKRVQAFFAKKSKLLASVWVGAAAKIRIAAIEGAFYEIGSSSLAFGSGRRRQRVRVFRATMPNGKRGLWGRKPNAKHRERPDGQWTQLPIEEPALRIDVDFARRSIERHSTDFVRDFLPDEFKRLIEVRAERLAGKKARK